MESSFKILTYNINKSRPWHFLKDSYQEIRQFIVDSAVDVVFLQEIMGEHKKKNFQKPRYEELSDSIWSDFAYAKNAITQTGNHGNAILSKFPITNWEQENLSTNRFEQRGLLYCEIDLGQPVSLYCVHLDLLLKGRIQQITRILERIASEPPEKPVILAGDFNDWEGSIGRLILKNSDLIDAYHSTTGKFAKTFPSYYPLLPLDRIYTRNIEVISSKVLKEKQIHSDHLPLAAEFKIYGPA